MAKATRIVVANIGSCPICSEEIQSKHRHDFVMCKCGKSGLDGGLDYIRAIGSVLPQPVYHDDDFKLVRDKFFKEDIGVTIPLSKIPNQLIEMYIDTESSPHYRETMIFNLYQKELDFRMRNDIFIDL